MSDSSSGSIPKPQSIEEVIDLIKRISDPAYSRSSTASRFTAKATEVIHELQKSDSAWDLADRLLKNDDQNVRFFGALTLTVKINTDWRKLSESTESEKDAILRGLLNALVQAVDRNESRLVTQKLCSSLVKFLSWPIYDWTQIVPLIAQSFHRGASMGIDGLKTNQIICLFWVVNDLAEQLSTKYMSQSEQ
jgi:hypothetical protein